MDFKEAKANFKEACNDLAEAAVCFANAGGGVIVVGVADARSGLEAFVGCDLDAESLRSRIHQLTSPSLLVEVEGFKFSDKRLIEITVPEGLEVYSTSKGYTYQRINTDCVPMRPMDVTRLTEERRGVDWSATPSDRDINDIDPLALRYCRRLLSSSADSLRQRYASFSDIDLLRALRLTADDDHLTKAGDLLLCSEATSGPSDLIVYQHKRTQAGESDAILRLGGPLILAFEEIVQAVRARQGITPVTLANGQQLQIEDYPSAAFREALVNAAVHGDWRSRQPIQIEHSPQYLRITSPGPLVSGVTVNNILTRGSRARFPSLAAAFRLLGLAEEVGQGVDRMYREMIRSGRDIPLISEDQQQVAVLFRGQNPKTRITKFLSTLPLEEQDDTDTLLILRQLCEKRTIKADGVADYIQRSVDEAQVSLRRLSSEPVSMLEPTRGTVNRKLPSYRLRAEVVAQLGNAVSYHSRAIDDIDKKIIDHLNDYGEVNNRTIQRLFDVDVYQARDILQSLVGREIIARSSTQTRGVAVKYSPGPSFPSPKKRKSQSITKANVEPDPDEEAGRLF
ncbi:RNA-binding domain-containing protein [Lentzea albidocapillata]|uniref:RNA-binding domain-containing protein n=1 Tax=Lentzea albidocapillata TaxID=40571 RepID=UPI001FECE6A2|nr:RNA-binding domain-containing protein [Lentzea albidocapillata]